MLDHGLLTYGVALLSAAAFLGAVVQAASGYGFAIVAAPVFLAVTGSTGAVPLLVLLHLVQSAMLVPGVLGEVRREALARLLAGAAIGCPVGLGLFLLADVKALQLAVGVLILGATGLIVARERGWIAPAGQADALPRDGPGSVPGWPAITTGAISGLMTSLLVMPGPPLMVWSMGARLGKREARALSLTFFAVCYVAVSLLNIAAGQVGRQTWTLVLALAPVVAAGTLVGQRIGAVMSELWFRRIVLGLLGLSGVGALITATL